jgi:hypothetical protein
MLEKNCEKRVLAFSYLSVLLSVLENLSHTKMIFGKIYIAALY